MNKLISSKEAMFETEKCDFHDDHWAQNNTKCVCIHGIQLMQMSQLKLCVVREYIDVITRDYSTEYYYLQKLMHAESAVRFFKTRSTFSNRK